MRPHYLQKVEAISRLQEFENVKAPIHRVACAEALGNVSQHILYIENHLKLGSERLLSSLAETRQAIARPRGVTDRIADTVAELQHMCVHYAKKIISELRTSF